MNKLKAYFFNKNSTMFDLCVIALVLPQFIVGHYLFSVIAILVAAVVAVVFQESDAEVLDRLRDKHHES